MGPMLRWFVFTITFGLLPFGFSMLLQALHGSGSVGWRSSPELLFFFVMVCSVQMGEMFGAPALGGIRRTPRRTFFGIMFSFFLVGAVVSAALYGVYVDQERNAECSGFVHPPDPSGAAVWGTCGEWLDFQANLFTFSMWLAAVLGSAATFTEYVRTRRRK